MAQRPIDLSMAELRAVAGFALACALPVLHLFERQFPDDPRPRAALDATRDFVTGGRRNQALRVTAVAAHRAAKAAAESGHAAAADAARAAADAAAAGYLHPLAQADQVKHILGSAAHAARALELDAGDDLAVGAAQADRFAALAGPLVSGVLNRYPVAPAGQRRVDQLLSRLDASVRTTPRAGSAST